MKTSRGLRIALSCLLAGVGLGLALSLADCSKPIQTPRVAPAVLAPPLADAEVGEQLVWVRGQDTWTWTVISTSDLEVEVRVEKAVAGEPTNSSTETWHRNSWGLDSGRLIRRIERDVVIDAHGEQWDCWKLVTHTRDEVRVFWVTDELPVHGIVKIARIHKGALDEDSAIRMTRFAFPDGQ